MSRSKKCRSIFVTEYDDIQFDSYQCQELAGHKGLHRCKEAVEDRIGRIAIVVVTWAQKPKKRVKENQ